MLKTSAKSAAKTVLHLEDSSEDAELVADSINKGDQHYVIHLVSGRFAFTDKIKLVRPDVILSDFKLPDIDGFEALEIAKEYAPDTPFLFVTGALGEEMAVSALKSGATDFILKSNLGRLLFSINRAIDEKRIAWEIKRILSMSSYMIIKCRR